VTDALTQREQRDQPSAPESRRPFAVLRQRGSGAVANWPIAVLLVFVAAAAATSADGLTSPDLTGLVAAAAGYTVAVRWGVWRWLAIATTFPLLLDDRLLHQVDGRGAVGVLLILCALVVIGWRAWPRQVTWVPTLVTLALGALLVATADPVSSSTSLGPVPLSAEGLSMVQVVGLLLALGAAAGLGRARYSAPMRLMSLLLLVAPMSAIAAPGYVSLLALVWWPVAGAIGLTALLRGSRGRGAVGPQGDDIDHDALTRFQRRYDDRRLAPVTVVIAAYNEAEGLPGVLHELPSEVCGLPADILVVDDGSTDGTADALAHSRAFVADCRANRGQGAALRLGYRIAREHGARYIITTDADGQYDAADFPVVLAPILEGRADFVTGSRILGHQHTLDRVRRTGVHVFAGLASTLTGHTLTDTSFGLRAMSVEVTSAVTLAQPQYQSSELLLGAISHGFRVTEVPGTMHVRSAGSTKKGRNLVYGSNYARAMTGTWWREGCPRPAPEVAAALRPPTPLLQRVGTTATASTD
jgi:Glycosyl transferase family 2